MKKKNTSWEPVAEWYDTLLADTDTYQAKVILPNLLRLLPPSGKRILDIACGQGFFARANADGGAEVMGVDISPELIRIAKAGERPGLRFEVADAEHLANIQDSSFDGALIVLALQNIKDMPAALAEAARALVPGGMLVVVLNHPAFRVPQASAWEWDAEKKIQYRRVERYGIPFSVSIDMTPGTTKASEKKFTASFHRPLQDYVKALAKAGFVITALEEWISHRMSQAGPRAVAEDKARGEFPLFLTLVARRG